MMAKWETTSLVPASDFLRIYYEEWALSPHRISSLIYSFLGLPYTRHFRNVIDELSQQDAHRRGQPIKLQTSIFEWRHRLPFPLCRIVEEECNAVLLSYGYGAKCES